MDSANYNDGILCDGRATWRPAGCRGRPPRRPCPSSRPQARLGRAPTRGVNCRDSARSWAAAASGPAASALAQQPPQRRTPQRLRRPRWRHRRRGHAPHRAAPRRRLQVAAAAALLAARCGTPQTDQALAQWTAQPAQAARTPTPRSRCRSSSRSRRCPPRAIPLSCHCTSRRTSSRPGSSHRLHTSSSCKPSRPECSRCRCRSSIFHSWHVSPSRRLRTSSNSNGRHSSSRRSGKKGKEQQPVWSSLP